MKAFVETKHVTVRECGFANFLLKFEEEYISRRNERVKELEVVLYDAEKTG